MPLIGNTIELCAYPTDGNNESVAVTNPTITIYDQNKNIIDVIDSEDIINPELGTYKTNYTIPDGLSYLSYEFKGEIDTETYLERIKIPRTWTRD